MYRNAGQQNITIIMQLKSMGSQWVMFQAPLKWS